MPYHPPTGFGPPSGHTAGPTAPPIGDASNLAYNRPPLHTTYPTIPGSQSGTYGGVPPDQYVPGGSSTGQMPGQSPKPPPNASSSDEQTRRVQEVSSHIHVRSHYNPNAKS